MMSSLKPFSHTVKNSTDYTEFEVINDVLFVYLSDRMIDLIGILKLRNRIKWV